MAAAILFSFAIEEFGKAVLLHEAYEGGADPARVDGFYDHSVKIRAAESRVKGEHLRIGPAGDVDLSARLSGLYVDWKGEWTYGVRVTSAAIERSREGLDRAIRQARIEWSYGPTPYRSP